MTSEWFMWVASVEIFDELGGRVKSSYLLFDSWQLPMLTRHFYIQL